MSLDISLLTRDECECPTCGQTTEEHEVYEANITHNMSEMAREAGLFKLLWCPWDVPIEKASELIGPLAEALDDMVKRPDHYRKFNPSSGWGDFDMFIVWLEDLLEACELYPSSRFVAEG